MSAAGIHYVEAKDVAQIHADAAFAMMRKLDVVPHPHNFALFYALASDRIPDLKKTFEKLIAERRILSADLSAELYERFFGLAEEREELRLATQRMQTAMTQVGELMTAATGGASSYGRALESFNNTLGDLNDTDEISAAVDGILSETKQMLDVNSRLESKLRSSSQEILSIKQDLETLRKESASDPLTGIANRKLLDLVLRDAILKCDDNAGPLSVLMVDIDHFKAFNETYGHALGDQVLKLVARCMSDTIKGKDTAARYGGEEFAIVLPDTPLHFAVQVAENIRKQVSSKKVMNKRTGESLGQICLSIGVADYHKGDSAATMLERSDRAMLLAKAEGRNRVVTEDRLIQV